MSTLTVTVAATKYPVTVEEVRAALRIDSATEDIFIYDLIGVATENRELATSKAFITRTYQLNGPVFPTDEGGLIRLPVEPVQSITSVEYHASESGVFTTVTGSNYRFYVDDLGTYIAGIDGFTWPTAHARDDATRITFVAGYGGVAAVPQSIKHSIIMLVGHLYERREGSVTGNAPIAVPMGVEWLADPFRRYYI